MTAYSQREVARILRISPARLRYWERTALVRPSLVRGSRPAYGFRDLVRLKSVLGLVERGVPVRRIRRTAEAASRRIPGMESPLDALRAWGGREPVVVEDARGLFEADGQMLLDLRPGADPVARLASLPAEPAGADAGGPASAGEWFERGCVLDTDPATWDEAIAAYERALSIDPGHADAHCNLGTVYYNQGRRAAARERFVRALELEPLHLEANFNLASLLEEEGRTEASLRRYRSVLRVDPLYADAHVNIALVYEKLGLRAKAREHWRRYLQLDPGGPWAEVAHRHLH